MRLRYPLFLLLVLIGFQSAAQESWVVGSFQNKDKAVIEGERLSGATGVEVLLQTIETEPGDSYRLLVQPFSDEQDQARLRTQLEYAGVTDIWETDLPVNTPGIQSLFAVMNFDESEFDAIADIADIEADLGSEVADTSQGSGGSVVSDFLVAGSFQGLSEAMTLMERLQPHFDEVLIREAQVGQVTYHRVLFGPVLESKEALVSQAAAVGIDDPWTVYAVSYDKPLMATASPRVAPVEKVPPQVSKKPAAVNDTSGYNPATLRTGPSPFTGKK